MDQRYTLVVYEKNGERIIADRDFVIQLKREEYIFKLVQSVIFLAMQMAFAKYPDFRF